MPTRRGEPGIVLDRMRDAYGNLERRYATDVLLVPPSVTLEGDRVVWRLRRVRGVERAMRTLSRADAARGQWNARRVVPGADMLRRFVGLADAPPTKVVAFARTWGPLGICEHGLPSSHSIDCEPVGWNGRGGWEPVEIWRRYARRARALLLVSDRLRTGSPGDIEELRPLARDLAAVLLAAGRFGGGTRTRVCPPDWWTLVNSVVNRWLVEGDVRPRLLMSGNDARPRLALTPTWRFPVPEFSLFGVLGMQLAFAASGEKGLAFCSACGGGFEPGRQLRAGERHYCDECRASGAPQRWATAAHRARRRTVTPALERGATSARAPVSPRRRRS
jgi:hypothetical protein